MKSICLVLFAMLFSLSSKAHTTAKIKEILVFEDGNLIYIYPEGGVQNPPACHGSNGDYLSFSMSRPMAKEYLSVLTAAFMANKTVWFRTDGACTDQSVSDTIRYFKVVKG